MADWIFRLLNTPLAVEPTIREGSHDDFRIEVAETQENYIRLYLTDHMRDKTTEVMMGSHEALTRNGIRLPKISMEQRYKKSAGSHVLYLAFNRSFHLAYAVEYRVGRTFAHVAMALSEMGYKVSISAYDPMIRADMEGIQRLRRFNSLEVVRPKNHESMRRVRSGGLIATGRSMDLLQPLSACRDMKRAYGRAHLMGWLSLLAGTGLSALAIVLGGEAFLISGLISVWQILLSAGMFALSRTAKGNKTPARDTDKEKKPAEVSSVKPRKKATRK